MRVSFHVGFSEPRGLWSGLVCEAPRVQVLRGFVNYLTNMQLTPLQLPLSARGDNTMPSISSSPQEDVPGSAFLEVSISFMHRCGAPKKNTYNITYEICDVAYDTIWRTRNVAANTQAARCSSHAHHIPTCILLGRPSFSFHPLDRSSSKFLFLVVTSGHCPCDRSPTSERALRPLSSRELEARTRLDGVQQTLAQHLDRIIRR